MANSGWVANTGTVNDALTTDNGDTSFAEAGSDGEACTLAFADPSVAESGISSITSVQILTTGRYPPRGSGGTDVDFLFEVGASTGLAETLNYSNSAVHGTQNGTARTVNTAGSAWSYSDLEDVELRLTKNGTVSADVRITMVNLLVTYVEATGYGNAVMGVASANISEVNGVATANIAKVIGVD